MEEVLNFASLSHMLDHLHEDYRKVVATYWKGSAVKWQRRALTRQLERLVATNAGDAVLQFLAHKDVIKFVMRSIFADVNGWADAKWYQYKPNADTGTFFVQCYGMEVLNHESVQDILNQHNKYLSLALEKKCKRTANTVDTKVEINRCGTRMRGVKSR